MIRPHDTVLFQGDSITHAFRKPDELNHAYQMGNGYAFLVASQLLLQRPGDDLKFLNRGVSGNRLSQVEARWKEDCLDLKPDVVSLLIGINDSALPTPAKEYKRIYRGLLKQTRQALPDVRFVLCEPFLLRCGSGTDERSAALAPLRIAVRYLAEEFGAVFVPLQSVFDMATKKAPPAYWSYDGVHPTAAGFALIARVWLEAAGC